MVLKLGRFEQHYQKYLESFEVWWRRRMETISWTDHVWNEEVLLKGQGSEEYPTWKNKRKANWIGHILRRNCLLQRVIEGKIKGEIEVTVRLGRRRRNLLDDLKEKTGYSHLNEEAVDRTMWTARFGRGFGPVARQTTKWVMNRRFVNSLQICTVAQMRKSSTSTKSKEYSALPLLY
jgi:hypothetical protein